MNRVNDSGDNVLYKMINTLELLWLKQNEMQAMGGAILSQANQPKMKIILLFIIMRYGDLYQIPLMQRTRFLRAGPAVDADMVIYESNFGCYYLISTATAMTRAIIPYPACKITRV